ncbi:MAG: ParB N-terminal domain-containing protein [Clostridia bacterium]|nr:ParB N-terminal domain-containing protein [Clostridia bacterium]
MLAYDRTLTTARAFAEAGRIEEWIHAYLCSDGHNQPFSDGLKLEKRFYIGPVTMPLHLFTRCCGPEETMKWRVDAEGFHRRVSVLADAIRSHADLPPLIVQYTAEGFTLTDGNHRYEAYKQCGITEVAVILWGTGQADERSLRGLYHEYL